MKLLIICIFILFSQLIFSQKKVLIDSLNIYKEKGELIQALHISNSIPKDSLTNYECLNIAEINNIYGNKNEAINYLELTFKKDSLFKDIWNFSKTNSYELINDSRFHKICDLIVTNSIINNTCDKNIMHLLVEMLCRDRSYYYQVYLSENNIGKTHPITLALWDFKEKINRENIVLLDSIIDKKGWLTDSLVCGFSGIPFFIIQHSDLETQKRYLPIIEKAFELGNANFNWVAMLTDRICLREGKPQIYGSQGIWNPKLKRNVLYVVENKDEVNKLRAKYKIGEPISDEAFENMFDPNNQ
jgi:hypothetical protein